MDGRGCSVDMQGINRITDEGNIALGLASAAPLHAKQSLLAVLSLR